MILKNKMVLITGGARMGVAMGRAFGARGAHVLLSYRHSRASADAAVKTLTEEGLIAESIQASLDKLPDINRLAHTIYRRYKRLDVLVHMASIYEKIGLFSPEAPKAWKDHMAAHVESAASLCRTFAPFMQKSKEGGRFIFITDWTVASGRPRYRDYTPYYVSKMALQGLVQSLALELAPKILVNAIAPGPILPPPGLSSKEKKSVEQSTPLHRWGGPEELAKTAVFLTETDFVTGETIRVDGGRHLY